jgi:hypothetical protein
MAAEQVVEQLEDQMILAEFEALVEIGEDKTQPSDNASMFELMNASMRLAAFIDTYGRRVLELAKQGLGR